MAIPLTLNELLKLQPGDSIIYEAMGNAEFVIEEIGELCYSAGGTPGRDFVARQVDSPLCRWSATYWAGWPRRYIIFKDRRAA